MAEPTKRTARLQAEALAEPEAPVGGRRSLSFATVGIVLVLAAMLLLLRLGSQERGGPAHEDLNIGDGIPATLYLPEDSEDGGLPDPKPAGERPPLVIVAHGYSADRASMSGMSRSLAEAGYAVLSFEFRGHGANTNRFRGELREDFAAAFDWAETTPWADKDHIAVLGHSMGASAALDFASVDSRPEAVIPVSGGWVLNDAVVPAHTLLLVASGDPSRIAERQDEVARDLRAAGGEVRQSEVGGTDHITILRSSDAMRDIITFLDPIMGIDRDGDVPGIDDPRYKTALLYLLVVLGLIALVGSLVGRLVPTGDGDDGGAPIWSGFVLVGGALLVTLPLMAVGAIDPLPIGAGQPIVVHLALASGVLWGLRALAQRGEVAQPVAGWLGTRDWLPLRSVGFAGLAAGGALFALLAPLSGVFHRLVPTPQRLVYWILVSLLCLPFFAAFEALMRRGSSGRSVLWSSLGRIVLLLVLVVGLALGTVPQVVALVLPLLLGQYILLEVFAAAAYARSRNAAVVAVVDAFVVGWMATALTPVG